MYAVTYNEYVNCPKCKQSWQLIDWGCALHRLTCGNIEVPKEEQERITASAESHGVTIRWN